MSRIRKKEYDNNRHWNVGIYIRLSKEDGKDESLSVTNQKKIIIEYLQNFFEDHYTLKQIYIDDGVTGTDYDRPDFQRMIHDMEKGYINCIICKNLSRMFRNYSDQGYFLEKVFPLYKIRFLTVSEPKVDSFLYPEAITGLEIPINGLMNDRFAAKTSRDIRDTFATKRRKGEFIGAFAPYGYQKSTENKNKLVIDEEAAQIVRDIFKYFVYEGMSKQSIAKYLNEQGIYNPSYYKKSKGLHYYNPQINKSSKNSSYWSPSSITAILKNEMYIGTMVQGKQTVISYKIHNIVSVPKKDWYVVPNTHEAIIDLETFQKAQYLQKKDTRTAPKNKKVHILAGFLYCADCQKAMTRQKTKSAVYYYCRTYQDKSKKLCTKHSIKEETILKVILEVIQKQIALLCISEIKKQIKNIANNDATKYQKTVENRKKEINNIKNIIDGLHYDWKNGDISREEYHRLKTKYEIKIQQIEQIIQNIRHIPVLNTDDLEMFLKSENITYLNRGILVELIKKISIHKNKEIEIEFHFSNPYSINQ